MSADIACSVCGAPVRIAKSVSAGETPVCCPQCASRTDVKDPTPADEPRAAANSETIEAPCTFCAAGSRTIALLAGAVNVCPRCGRDLRDDPEVVAQWNSPTPPSAPSPMLEATTDEASGRDPVTSIEGPATSADGTGTPQSAPQETAAARSVVRQIARLDPATLAGFFLGCWALFVAGIGPLGALSKLLSGLGLLAAAAGLWRAQRHPATWLVPGSICVLCLLELAFAGTWPRQRGWAAARPAAPMVVGLNAADTKTRLLHEREWVDAATGGIQQHELRVRIVSARIDTVAAVDAAKPKGAPAKHLLIELRMAYLSKDPYQALVYVPWSDQLHAPSSNPPLLVDQMQRSYDQIPFDVAWTATRKSDTLLAAGTEIGELLVYPLPAGDVEYLRLDLPGSAFALPGRFRFEIPRGMIQGL